MGRNGGGGGRGSAKPPMHTALHWDAHPDLPPAPGHQVSSLAHVGSLLSPWFRHVDPGSVKV